MSEDTYSPEDDHPHVPDKTCGRCRKNIEKGHRVIQAFIVDRAGRDPMNLSRSGLYLFEEFEFVHASCDDPFLKKGIRGA